MKKTIIIASALLITAPFLTGCEEMMDDGAAPSSYSQDHYSSTNRYQRTGSGAQQAQDAASTQPTKETGSTARSRTEAAAETQVASPATKQSATKAAPLADPSAPQMAPMVGQ